MAAGPLSGFQSDKIFTHHHFNRGARYQEHNGIQYVGSVANYLNTSDGRTGNGGYPMIFIFTLNPTTGQLAHQGSKGYDIGIEDSIDAFEFYDDYFMVVLTFTTFYENNPIVPFLSVFNLSNL